MVAQLTDSLVDKDLSGCKTKWSIVFSGSTFLGLLFCNPAAPLGVRGGGWGWVKYCIWRWGKSLPPLKQRGGVALFTDVRQRNKAWIIDAALCRAGNISGYELFTLLRFSLLQAVHLHLTLTQFALLPVISHASTLTVRNMAMVLFTHGRWALDMDALGADK